jgi:hypothetical protein
VYLDHAAGLVIELLDDLPVGGLAHHLRPGTIHLLRGVVERLADIAGGPRESIGDLARGFVDQIVHPAAILGQRPRLAPLQTPPAS